MSIEFLTILEYNPNRFNFFGVDYEMVKYQRTLDISLPPGQSAWLCGPRRTGKTTYLKARYTESAVFDLLDTDLVVEGALKSTFIGT